MPEPQIAQCALRLLSTKVQLHLVTAHDDGSLPGNTEAKGRLRGSAIYLCQLARARMGMMDDVHCSIEPVWIDVSVFEI